jgi:hypothetical protein
MRYFMVIINGCSGEFIPAYRHTSQTAVHQYFCSGFGGAVIEGREVVPGFRGMQ